MSNWRREIRWPGAPDGGRAPRTAAIPLAMGERGPQKPGRQMGRMGAEDPTTIRNQSSKEMSQLVSLGLQIAGVVAVGLDADGDLLHDLEAVALDADQLPGVV